MTNVFQSGYIPSLYDLHVPDHVTGSPFLGVTRLYGTATSCHES